MTWSAEELNDYVRLNYSEDGELIPSQLMRDFDISSYDENFREAHCWHQSDQNLVSRTPVFKRWGLTADQIKDMRTLIKDVEFVNPIGRHGDFGSTRAHNELLGIIDSSLNYETFVRRLRNWANYRLKGGVDALPPGLRP